MTSRKTSSSHNWTMLLPNGDTVEWNGETTIFKLGRHMIAATDGRLINPEQVVALTPPSGAE